MESEEGRGSEFAWLPDTSGTVASGSQAIARAGGVPALIKLLHTPEAGPPAAGCLTAMGVDVRTARVVVEGLAGKTHDCCWGSGLHSSESASNDRVDR